MQDFRNVLYEHYVTKFKRDESRSAGVSLQSYFAWCEHKLLPLLEGLPRTARLLELGCGPGYMLEFLKLRGFTDVRGIDISAEQIDLARSRGCEAELVGVFNFLTNERLETFDGIIGLDFIEHFSRDELIRLIPLIHNCLRGGGRMILQTPNGAGLFAGQVIYGDLSHCTIFSSDSLRQILEVSGFKSIAFMETGPVPKNVIGVLRLVGWRMIRRSANLLHKIETGKSQAIWTENMICIARKV